MTKAKTTTSAWKKIAAFAIALTMIGSTLPSNFGGLNVFSGSNISASAEEPSIGGGEEEGGEETGLVSYETYIPSADDDTEALAAKQVTFNNLNWYIIADDSTSEVDGTVTLFAVDSITSSRFGSSNNYANSTVKTTLANMKAENGIFADVAAGIDGDLFLLSAEEAAALPQEVRKSNAAPNMQSTSWWTSTASGQSSVVTYSGRTGNNSTQRYNSTYNVRPALKLDLSKVYFKIGEDSKEFLIHVHEFSEEWSSNDNGHWHECLGEGASKHCEEAEGYAFAEHTYGEEFEERYTCSVCGHVNETMRNHILFDDYKLFEAEKLEDEKKKGDCDGAIELLDAAIDTLLEMEYDDDLTYEENIEEVDGCVELALAALELFRKPDESLRIAGADRYATSLAAADKFMEENDYEVLPALVIATGTDYADALSAAYLAHEIDAPIILTNTKDKEMDRTIEYIHENCDKDTLIYIIGGEGAISLQFEKLLTTSAPIEQQYQVTRLFGKDRYATNIAVLEEAGIDEDDDLIIASGLTYADALSASATAQPMLFVGPTLTDDQEEFLEEVETDSIVIVGGTGAVSEDVETDLTDMFEKVERLSGAGRYETSKLIAEKYFPKTLTVGLAFANDYPDGIVGSALAMTYGCPILLVTDDNFEDARAYAAAAFAEKTVTFGGTSRISDETVSKIIPLKEDEEEDEPEEGGEEGGEEDGEEDGKE